MTELKKRTKKTSPCGNAEISLSAVQSYLKKVVVKDGCWAWNGAKTCDGYGRVNNGRNKSPIGAHRVSWFIHKGKIPRGLFVLHKCDNPECTNPDHLFLGTQRDNIIDAFKKGRIDNFNHESGENNNVAKLSMFDVKKIRAEYSSGKTMAEISINYPGFTNITRVVRNKVYSDPQYKPINGNKKPRPWRKKIDGKQISEIISMPLPSRQIAKKYGVSKTTILKIKAGNYGK